MNPHIPHQNKQETTWPNYRLFFVSSVQPITQQCESSTVQIHLYEKYEHIDHFCYEKKPLHAATELTLFTVSKDEWSTKDEAMLDLFVAST